jgi:hypothetical protein
MIAKIAEIGKAKTIYQRGHKGTRRKTEENRSSGKAKHFYR